MGITGIIKRKVDPVIPGIIGTPPPPGVNTKQLSFFFFCNIPAPMFLSSERIQDYFFWKLKKKKRKLTTFLLILLTQLFFQAQYRAVPSEDADMR